MSFDKHVLDIDAPAESERIVNFLRRSVFRVLRRRGGVVGISGGVDSAVVLALMVRAFGAGRTCALILPERDSDPESRRLALDLAAQYGVKAEEEEITAALEGLGCYARRDAAIRRVFSEYRSGLGYRARVTLPDNLLEKGTLNVPLLTIVRPDGTEDSAQLAPEEASEIVAASNMKQRTRMTLLYYHAERRHYAVIGTANKNEHDQGFFVKHGDAGVDVKPIVHLYKTQIYQLAEYLGVPRAIRERTPTSDTYSAPASQQEFFFRLPFETMDLLWYAQEHGVPQEEVARVTGFSAVQIRRAFGDFTQKARSTAHLRMYPLSIDSETQSAGKGAASGMGIGV
jgi:NAD+ synthase